MNHGSGSLSKPRVRAVRLARTLGDSFTLLDNPGSGLYRTFASLREAIVFI